jgi:hypothetical protein
MRTSLPEFAKACLKKEIMIFKQKAKNSKYLIEK